MAMEVILEPYRSTWKSSWNNGGHPGAVGSSLSHGGNPGLLEIILKPCKVGHLGVQEALHGTPSKNHAESNFAFLNLSDG